MFDVGEKKEITLMVMWGLIVRRCFDVGSTGHRKGEANSTVERVSVRRNETECVLSLT